LLNTKGSSFNGILEQIYAKNTSLVVTSKAEVPVRRNLIQKFEQEAQKNQSKNPSQN
jgi:hypothetical protein